MCTPLTCTKPRYSRSALCPLLEQSALHNPLHNPCRSWNGLCSEPSFWSGWARALFPEQSQRQQHGTGPADAKATFIRLLQGAVLPLLLPAAASRPAARCLRPHERCQGWRAEQGQLARLTELTECVLLHLQAPPAHTGLCSPSRPGACLWAGTPPGCIQQTWARHPALGCRGGGSSSTTTSSNSLVQV